MQYGILTDSQINKFRELQSYIVRRPTYSVWIEGVGNPTEYIMEIDTEVALESPLGRGLLNIGKATLVVNNEDGFFYSGGKSKIRRNSRMKIWAGFDKLNIPIFTGVVHSVCPKGKEDIIILNCTDYMGLFQEMLIKDNQEPNNTVKTFINSLCELIYTNTVLQSTDETTYEYTNLTFEEKSVLAALEDISNSIFYTAYFDENGRLNAVERESGKSVNFQFNDRNVINCENLPETEIINDITIEYDEGFFSKCESQWSIDTYGRSSRSYRLTFLNSILVSEITTGSTSKILEYDLEAFKFTSSGNSALIDSLHIKMRKNEAQGFLYAKIYLDNNGIPGDLLAISQLKSIANLSNTMDWEVFCFSKPFEILPSSNYWVVIDTSSLNSGEVYVQIDEAGVSGKYAYYSDSWNLVDNKQVLHAIRGSVQARRLAEDMVSFYSSPSERIKITSPAVPQLQILDDVFVNIKMREIYGHYVIEGRRHIMSPKKYLTIDTLRKAEVN